MAETASQICKNACESGLSRFDAGVREDYETRS